MNHRAPNLLFSCLILCASCHSVPQVPLSSAMKSPPRLLFVGNSFTFYNGGLENHFRLLAESARPPHILVADQATKGGATLKILQGLSELHAKIRHGRYDLVVLQEDIPELKEHDVTPFLEQVRLFDREIRDTGGRTVLFLAWPYERLNWVGMETIAGAHRAISKELNLPVAPVGLAFQRSIQARPGLAILGKDREHETLHGTYLAANVIYATLFGVNPIGLSYRPQGVSAEEAAFLQGIAWSAVKDWQTLR